MAEKRVPLCQAKLKSGRRCPEYATGCTISRNSTPMFLCDSHCAKDNAGKVFGVAIEEISVESLPDDMLDGYLQAAKDCYADLSDEVYYAQRRCELARVRLVAMQDEVRKRRGSA